MSNLIDGKKVAGEIKDEISKVISESISRGNRAPSIKIVLIGDHGPSKIYVNAKLKACESVGIEAELISLNDNINQDDLSELIADMNIDQDLDGFIVQLPLPNQVSVQKVIELIDPSKDIDGFTNDNIGSISSKNKKFKIGVVNLMGNVFMRKTEDVFKTAKEICKRIILKKNVDFLWFHFPVSVGWCGCGKSCSVSEGVLFARMPVLRSPS